MMDETKQTNDSEQNDFIGDLCTMSLSDENLADLLISKYDYLDSCISNEKFDASLCSNLVLLLKFILENGPHLDEDINHMEQMDMFFTLFRNILRNYLKFLPDSINLLILRLIEIRASRWKIKPAIEEYYIKKVDKLSNNNMFKPNNFRTNEKPTSSIRMSKSFGDIMVNNDNDSFRNSRLLKINSKGVLKDEVTIKNSDSGKVMGIKGRRVHMIEEMSETIISFQRVPPHSKDRLVQITGFNRESIEKAKNLIDVTIRQNISPIPFETEPSYSNDPPMDEETYFSSATEPETSKIRHSFININEGNILPTTEDGDHHLFTINYKNKEINIKTSDSFVGKKLEQFLDKGKFADFLNDNQKPEDNPVEVKKSIIMYERDFIISLKECNKYIDPNIAIEIKQHNLYRE